MGGFEMLKKLLTLTIACAVVMALVASSVGANDVEKLEFPNLNKLKLPDIEEVTLDNGIRLYLLEDKSLPLFEVSVRVSCGSYLDPLDKIGLADICGTVMRTGGTEKWTGDEIDEMLEAIGGAVETGIDVNTATAGVNVLSEYSDLGLDVLAEVLRRPVFDEDRIELAKVQQRSAISRRNDDISDVALREYRKLMYGNESPHARHAEYATIDAISRDDLIAFHKVCFQPQNIQIAIIGDFSKKEVIEAIITRFGDWANGEAPVPPPEVTYEWRNKIYYAEKQDAAQTYIRIGHMGGLSTDPDHADRLVMSSIYGGGFGSRLTNEVRVKNGLAYSVGGQVNSFFGYPGYFFSVASTSPENTVKATRLMIDQIKSMHTDLATETEMQKGRDGYLNSFVFNFDSKGEIINRMMAYDYYGIPDDFLEKVKERVENVTPEDVMAAAKRNIRPEELVVLIVGNAENFDEPLTALGMGEPEIIEITIPSGETEVELTITDETLAEGKQLLMQAAEAHGGVEAFKAINSTSTKGTFTIVTPQGEFPISFEGTMVFPGQSKSVLSVMGQQMIDITDGDHGWKSNQTGGLDEKTPEDIEAEAKENARDILFIFRDCTDDGYRAVSAGSGLVGDVPVDFVIVLDAEDGNVCRLALNTETHVLVSKSYWGQTMLGEGNVEEIYADLTEMNGVLLPMARTNTLNGQPLGAASYTEYVINGEIPEGTFAKPE